MLLEEKRRKREEARKAAAEKKAAKAAAAGEAPEQQPVEEEGCIIDNLLKEIRSGTTLRPMQRKPTVRAPKLSAKDMEQLKKMASTVVDSSAPQTSPAPQLAEKTNQSTEETTPGGGWEGGRIQENGVSCEDEQKPHPLAEARAIPVVNGNNPTLEVVAKETVVANGDRPSETVVSKKPPQHVAKDTLVVNGNEHSHEVVMETTEVKRKAPPPEAVSTETPVVNGNEPSVEVAPTAVSEVVKGKGEGGVRRRVEMERPLSPLERRLGASCSPVRDSDAQVSPGVWVWDSSVLKMSTIYDATPLISLVTITPHP